MCRTKAGIRCQNRAAPGERFCRRHASCSYEIAAEADSALDAVVTRTQEMKVYLDDIKRLARDLAAERDFYETKLERIEEALALPTAEQIRAHIRSILRASN